MLLVKNKIYYIQLEGYTMEAKFLDKVDEFFGMEYLFKNIKGGEKFCNCVKDIVLNHNFKLTEKQISSSIIEYKN